MALAVAGATGARADSLRYLLPEGWSVAREDDEYSVKYRFTRDTNDYVEREVAKAFGLEHMLPLYHPVDPITKPERQALESDLALAMATVRVVIGPPPGNDIWNTRKRATWNTVDDVWTYVREWEKRQSDFGEVTLNGWPGVAYTSTILPSRVYQLVYRPGTRIFVLVRPANTLHAGEVAALLESLQPQ